MVSSTFISFLFSRAENWNQVNDCRCCQVKEYMGLVVNLVCEDGRRLKKQLAMPRVCSCQNCASLENENKKTKTKG